jgi:signal transduction histidine kinase/transcriptional regulator with XRE-family HTH domain
MCIGPDEQIDNLGEARDDEPSQCERTPWRPSLSSTHVTEAIGSDDTAARKAEYQEALARFIRERRRVLRLTQRQLARRVGWGQERISSLESGKYGLPSILALSRLATAMESSLFEMLEAVGFDRRTVARAREEARDNENAFALLYTLQRILAIQATSLKETLDQASDMLAEVMNADNIDALIYRADGEALVALGTSNTPMGRRQRQIGMDSLPVANGGREVQVFETGEPYWSGHAKDDPKMLRGITEGLGVESLIIVPLEVNEVRRGVVLAASSRKDHFFDDDLPFLQAVARWVGMVAHRAELSEQLTAEAVQAARQVTAEELTTVLAHDLGNHLTPLKGHIDIIRRTAQRQGQDDYLAAADRALAAVERIRELSGDLLDAARLEHGLFALSHDTVDLVDLISDVARRCERAENAINLRLPVDCVVTADSIKLAQALENLVTNAIQHSPKGAMVEMALRRESYEWGEWAVIDVQDIGPGIPADLVQTLFGRFSKGSGSQGLGLGLYLARGIAEAHGGTLSVDSTLGVGTTFHLSVPLSVASLAISGLDDGGEAAQAGGDL